MKSIKVLDVTLRDGGCVNNFNFGNENIKAILRALEESKIDIIELGYIDDKVGSTSGRTTFLNEKVVRDSFLNIKEKNIKYIVMADYGKFDFNNLEARSPESIDGIRIAFHKENLKESLECAQMILEKGYEVYIQPMIIPRYTIEELLELVLDVNRDLIDISGFYIVDSFGEMKSNEVIAVLDLIDENLNPKIPIGIHSHNNLQLSYSIVSDLLEYVTDREFIFDSSILGMGKGAGNLNTELLTEHLNLSYGKSYISDPIYEVIDNILKPIQSENNWGYSPEYYLSAINHCSPSYASFYYNKCKLSLVKVNELLKKLDEKKRISFNSDYAKSIYDKYCLEDTKA